MSTDPLETSTRLVVDCWNRADWPRLRALTGPGYTYGDSGTGPAVGADAMLTGWARLRSGFPDASADIVEVCVDGPCTAASVVWRVVQSAPLPTVHGLEPPSYKRIVVADLVIMRWVDGLLVEERHQHGILSLLAPLLPVDRVGAVAGRSSVPSTPPG